MRVQGQKSELLYSHFMKQKKYLLSIDGGGIKGIIPISALVQLEQTTGKLARDSFSFVAGTSTGAIIAAAVAAGIPARILLDSYIHLSTELFRFNAITGIKRFFFGYKYSTQQLHDLIAQQLGEFSNWTLNDSPIDLLISAKRVKDGMPWYFVKDNPKNSKRTGSLPLVDCVTASASAPTVFYPWTIPEDVSSLPPGIDPVGTLTDGGVGIAGNPVYQACVEAFYYHDSYTPEHTTIVSLGTGHFQKESMPTWLMSWLTWVLEELLHSSGEQQTEIVYRHFSQVPFFRMDPDLKLFDPTLSEPIVLDDVSQVGRLVHIGKKFAQQIDWKKVLGGDDMEFKIDHQNTMWQQYKWPR